MIKYFKSITKILWLGERKFMGEKLKKIHIAQKMISNNSHLFKCPVCGNKMGIFDSPRLVCINKHSFDLSRQGYINMLLKANKTKYDKDMLESRNFISKSGFFDPMLREIGSFILKQESSSNSRHGFILDAGCGEGSHLWRILTDIEKKSHIRFLGVGIDISKEGISIAARDYEGIIWCVADLAKLPFDDRQFDVVLNILSPASYTEFSRILKDSGILIKVVPGRNYLIQLRNIFYDRTDKKSYSNEQVIHLFTQNFNMIEHKMCSYNVALDKISLRHLLNMTPLTWNVEKEKLEKAIEMGIREVTADFHIIIGKKF